MAVVAQTQELQESLKDFSLRMGANLDELSAALRHASKTCKAFAVDLEAAFPKVDLDAEAPEDGE